MGGGLPTSSTRRNEPVIGNMHLRAPLGDLQVEGASVRSSTPIVIGTTAKKAAVAPDASTEVKGWVAQKATTDKEVVYDSDYAAGTWVNAEAGPGVIRNIQLAANENVAPGDYLCANGDHTLRLWVDGVDPEGAKIAWACEASNVASVARIAAFCLK